MLAKSLQKNPSRVSDTLCFMHAFSPSVLPWPCQMQGLKKGGKAVMQEPAADTDGIPAGYITPLKARPCKTEVRT